MRTWSVIPALLLSTLLSGCLGGGTDGLDAETSADAPSDGDDAGTAGGADGGGTASAADAFVQEEDVSWAVPFSVACIAGDAIPANPGAGVAYAVVEVDERTHGAAYQIHFDGTDGVGAQVVFWSESGELEGSFEMAALGDDLVLEGSVPREAVQAHISSCGATALSAHYRAGDIE